MTDAEEPALGELATEVNASGRLLMLAAMSWRQEFVRTVRTPGIRTAYRIVDVKAAEFDLLAAAERYADAKKALDGRMADMAAAMQRSTFRVVGE